MKYAFIDVQNNDSTAFKTLGFVVDNRRLANFLIENKKCDKIFLYPGIEINDIEKKAEYENISSDKIIVRPKYYRIYKDKDTYIKSNCKKCDTEIVNRISGKTNYKCNCDVDLTIDMMDHMAKDNEILLFTGDGDFEYLIKRSIENGCKIKLISSNKSITRSDGSRQSRLSKKLQDMIKEDQENILFLELNNFKFSINKIFDK